MDKELEEYIEDNGFSPVSWGSEWYQCSGGHLWNIDEIEKEMNYEKEGLKGCFSPEGIQSLGKVLAACVGASLALAFVIAHQMIVTEWTW